MICMPFIIVIIMIEYMCYCFLFGIIVEDVILKLIMIEMPIRVTWRYYGRKIDE